MVMMMPAVEDSGSGREDIPNVVAVAPRDIVHKSHLQEAAAELHRRTIPSPEVEAEGTHTDERVMCPKWLFRQLLRYCSERAEAALPPQHACSRSRREGCPGEGSDASRSMVAHLGR